MARVLNALDGLDRMSEVVFIATTHDAKALPAALLRPGRLDAVLVFETPDAGAAKAAARRSEENKRPEVVLHHRGGTQEEWTEGGWMGADGALDPLGTL